MLNPISANHHGLAFCWTKTHVALKCATRNCITALQRCPPKPVSSWDSLGSSILQTKIMPFHQSLQTKQQPKPTIAKHVFPLRCDKKEPKCSLGYRSQLFRMKGTKTFLQRLRRLQLEPFLGEKVGISHPAVDKNPSHTNNPLTHFGESELCHGGKKQTSTYIYIYIWVFPKIGVPQNGWFIIYNGIPY